MVTRVREPPQASLGELIVKMGTATGLPWRVIVTRLVGCRDGLYDGGEVVLMDRIGVLAVDPADGDGVPPGHGGTPRGQAK